jgi:hypothetical protein
MSMTPEHEPFTVYLYVDPSGTILGNRRAMPSLLMEGIELWKSEFHGSYFIVRRLHPTHGRARRLSVPSALQAAIKRDSSKFDRKHQVRRLSANVVLAYALRSFPVLRIEFRQGAAPSDGCNLKKCISLATAYEVATFHATSVRGEPAVNNENSITDYILKRLCEILGGLIATNDNDGSSLDRPTLDNLLAAAKKTAQTLDTGALLAALRKLGTEILADSVVQQRQKRLEEAAGAVEILDQAQIETILADLPDYSQRIEAIRMEFGLSDEVKE